MRKRERTAYVFKPTPRERVILDIVQEARGVVIKGRTIANLIGEKTGEVVSPDELSTSISTLHKKIGRATKQKTPVAIIANTGRALPQALRGYYDAQAGPRYPDGRPYEAHLNIDVVPIEPGRLYTAGMHFITEAQQIHPRITYHPDPIGSPSLKRDGSPRGPK